MVYCSLLRNNVIQGGNQLVDVDAVRHGALLDVLEVGGCAADAAHAGLHEYRNGVRVLGNNLHDGHFLVDSHIKLHSAAVAGGTNRNENKGATLLYFV